jgi:hypothetical protein
MWGSIATWLLFVAGIGLLGWSALSVTTRIIEEVYGAPPSEKENDNESA